MSDMDIRGLFAIGFISVMFICIGFLIKKFNLAEMVSGYNSKKHENHKELISKCMGNLLLYNGLFALTAFVLNLIFKLISMSLLSHIVFGIVALSIIAMMVYVNAAINKLDKNQQDNN